MSHYNNYNIEYNKQAGIGTLFKKKLQNLEDSLPETEELGRRIGRTGAGLGYAIKKKLKQAQVLEPESELFNVAKKRIESYGDRGAWLSPDAKSSQAVNAHFQDALYKNKAIQEHVEKAGMIPSKVIQVAKDPEEQLFQAIAAKDSPMFITGKKVDAVRNKYKFTNKEKKDVAGLVGLHEDREVQSARNKVLGLRSKANGHNNYADVIGTEHNIIRKAYQDGPTKGLKTTKNVANMMRELRDIDKKQLFGPKVLSEAKEFKEIAPKLNPLRKNHVFEKTDKEMAVLNKAKATKKADLFKKKYRDAVARNDVKGAEKYNNLQKRSIKLKEGRRTPDNSNAFTFGHKDSQRINKNIRARMLSKELQDYKKSGSHTDFKHDYSPSKSMNHKELKKWNQQQMKKGYNKEVINLALNQLKSL